MTELIFAVDTSQARYQVPALADAGVEWFKLDPWILLDPLEFTTTLRAVRRAQAKIFFDLKLYQPAVSVHRIARRLWSIPSIHMLTVFADHHMLARAHEARTSPDQKVLAVGSLTDGNGAYADFTNPPLYDVCDGFICAPNVVPTWRSRDEFTRHLFVCPAVSPNPQANSGHNIIFNPREVAAYGADFAVVGSAIYLADNPVAEAQIIMRELREG